jgi:hypothetical protein
MGSRAVLLWGLASSAHGFGRVNVLVSRIPVPGPALQGLPGPTEYKKVDSYSTSSVAVLGNSILFTDPERNRILRLQEGRLTVFAGNGGNGEAIDPGSALHTQLCRPYALLVLRDGSVLVSRVVGLAAGHFAQVVLRIRPQPRDAEPTVSLFAGNGHSDNEFIQGPAVGIPLLGVSAMAEERDGSVLIADSLASRVVRVRPDGAAELLAGTGFRGTRIDPVSGPRTQLCNPFALAVLEDDSVLINDYHFSRHLLRIWPNQAVTVYAGQEPGAEHSLAADSIDAIISLPDRSVWLGAGFHVHGTRWNSVLLRVGPEGVTLLAGAGPGPDGPALDPQHVPGLMGAHEGGFSQSMVALRDGSAVIAFDGKLLLVSPADPLQGRLESLVDAGNAAVRSGNLDGYRQAEQSLAGLCAANSGFRSINHAARDQGRLELPGLDPRLHLIPDLGQIVQRYAGNSPTERLRAQLALRELRKFKRGVLGR